MEKQIVAGVALHRGYSSADIQAGIEFHDRKRRLKNPPGEFDKAGRFTAAERTAKVRSARAPSRA